ncbi:MAG: dihydrofolate reductase [Rhodobacteraceae bacterium]|nr:dihydrofolate reductase [Paracoccaceae bacterium]
MQPALAQAEVFIATSVDGFIARENGDIGWLTGHPVPEGEDYGFAAFMEGVDAIVMGRATFDTVRGFGDWPYQVPVVVLSRKPEAVSVPEGLQGRVRVTAESPAALLAGLAEQGAERVYIDSGQVIRAFLTAGLVRRMVVSTIPVLLGAGRPLWGHGAGDVPLTLARVRHWPNAVVQADYRL